MSELSLLFSDGTSLQVEQVVMPLAVIVQCQDLSTLYEVWGYFLDTEKVETVQVQVDGVTASTYNYLTVEGVQTTTNNDGSMTAHFYLSYSDGDNISDTEALQIIMGEIE